MCTANATCGTCGAMGQACCAGQKCTGASLVCGGGPGNYVCDPCGATGQPCCAGKMCATGTCHGDTCQ
jgi:hypothetical protein